MHHVTADNDHASSARGRMERYLVRASNADLALRQQGRRTDWFRDILLSKAISRVLSKKEVSLALKQISFRYDEVHISRCRGTRL